LSPGDAPRIQIRLDDDGEVVLTGAVSTPRIREIAEEVVQTVPGIAGVRDYLRTDLELTGDLRKALRRDPLTSPLADQSAVIGGVAELRGSAPAEARLAAMRAADAIGGVRDVVTDVRPPLAGDVTDVRTAA
jgi:osmotically-inducible protein OsmY